jgi:predicted dehydrogenase
LRAAIIGLGVMGRIHYRILKSLPGVEVTGLCDPAFDPAFQSSEPHHATIDSLLAATRPDFAVIAVPTPLHTDVALRCIDKGIHLLIEKPVAAGVAEGERILGAAQKAGVKSAVGHVERFNPVVQALRRELAGRDIFSVSFTRVGHLPPRIGDVGVLTDLAVHDIDLVTFVTGRTIVRSSIYKSRKIHNHFEDNANLAFELSGEVLATITTNWLTPFKKRTIEVTTQDGYFVADLIGQQLTEYSAYTDDDRFVTRVCSVRKGEPLQAELAAFVEYLRSGARGELASIEDSLLTLRVIAGTLHA